MLKRFLIPGSCCLIFCLVFIKYGHAQPGQAETSQAEIWLKEDNSALRERLKELKNSVAQQQKTQAELEARLVQLQKTKDVCVEKPKDDGGSRLKTEPLSEKISALQKEKGILETMLGLKVKDDFRPPDKVKAAEKSFDKVVHLNLAYAYGRQGKTKEAIKEYLEASQYDPQDKDIHYNLGYLLSMENSYQEAIDEYRKSLKGTSQDREVYYNLAVIYATALKDSSTAQEYYQKFLQLASAGKNSAAKRKGVSPRK